MAWSSSLKSLLTVFVFSILAVSSVGSYQCTKHQCINETCSPTEVCTASKGCFNQIQTFHAPSTDQIYTEKGCSTDTCSDLERSATLGAERRFNYLNRCCTTEQCNKDNLTVSPAPAEANGIQCPAYYEEPGMMSFPTLLRCTGKETKCGLVIGTGGSNNIFSFVMSGMGCMTENACNLNFIALGNINIQTFCFNVSPPGSTGFRLTSITTVPILIILLLLKVLF